ncbi:unnamed protein product [Phyllotreta striolata]|uniref:Uncharacterized protein n=1 Tax=Phyllotreta striolata TaxID=444603 RepID=A0A9N9XT83_PHYSR|nr:unnamed protein product [Phyllotreta striolata]
MYKLLRYGRWNNLNQIQRVIKRDFTNTSVLLKNEPTEDEGPIKYSQSPAVKYKAKDSRIGDSDNRLWYEPYVIIASLSAFLIYFTVLREENDIDVDLSRSLYSRIDGMEEFQLRQLLQYNLKNGIETDSITRRLKQLEDEKKASDEP